VAGSLKGRKKLDFVLYLLQLSQFKWYEECELDDFLPKNQIT
jgi:hypothetical protein